jgi:pimeloyl-ACP methyl ester carboxylesterase
VGRGIVIVAGLSTRAVGHHTAPALVLLHGGGLGSWAWGSVVERLSPAFHCLIPDLPEHGQSANTGPFSIDDAAHRVAHLIREQAHEGRAIVVGLSLGGQIGLALQRIAPQQVERAVLSGVLVRPIPGASLLLPLLRGYYPLRNLRFLVRANMAANAIPKRYFSDFQANTRQLTLGALTRIWQENLSFRVPDGLQPIVIPTLAVVGERERKVLHESACEIVAILPQAEGRCVAGVGHHWSLTAPERFAQMIEAWTTGRPLPDWLLPLPC